MAKQPLKTSATTVADVLSEQLQARVLELEGLLAAKTTEHEDLKSLYEAVLGEKGTLETEKIVSEMELTATKEEKATIEAELETLKSASATTEVNDLEVEIEVVEEELPVHTLTDGRKFSFTKKAPKHLKVLGVVHSQAELVKNKEAMEFLIYGNSFFVEQINSK